MRTVEDQLRTLSGVQVPERSTTGPWRQLRQWPVRRWLFAAGGAAATLLTFSLTTAMIPNPVFGRSVPTTWWAWPALVITAVLGGLLGATYIRAVGDATAGSRVGTVGGLLSYFALGCPVCNKLALLALGYAGALQWFAPAQPYLAVLGIIGLVWAFRRRLQGEVACAVSS